MADVKTEIMQRLNETEINYDVKIPFAIESGSRGWGFASPDSDYDCRFIYVHKKDWYISILEKKDIIEYAVDAVFDVNGWDLKKALQHIIKSNAVMFEWLYSNEIYICDERVIKRLKSLADEFFNPVALSYHYLSIAKNMLSEILSADEAKLKKYFYVLRPIANLNFIYQHRKIPYMEYDKTLSETDIENDILCIIHELKQAKLVSDESFKIKQNIILIEYFHREIKLFEERLKNMRHTKNRDYKSADTVFKSIIEDVWQDE